MIGKIVQKKKASISLKGLTKSPFFIENFKQATHRIWNKKKGQPKADLANEFPGCESKSYVDDTDDNKFEPRFNHHMQYATNTITYLDTHFSLNFVEEIIDAIEPFDKCTKNDIKQIMGFIETSKVQTCRYGDVSSHIKVIDNINANEVDNGIYQIMARWIEYIIAKSPELLVQFQQYATQRFDYNTDIQEAMAKQVYRTPFTILECALLYGNSNESEWEELSAELTGQYKGSKSDFDADIKRHLKARLKMRNKMRLYWDNVGKNDDDDDNENNEENRYLSRYHMMKLGGVPLGVFMYELVINTLQKQLQNHAKQVAATAINAQRLLEYYHDRVWDVVGPNQDNWESMYEPVQGKGAKSSMSSKKIPLDLQPNKLTKMKANDKLQMCWELYIKPTAKMVPHLLNKTKEITTEASRIIQERIKVGKYFLSQYNIRDFTQLDATNEQNAIQWVSQYRETPKQFEIHQKRILHQQILSGMDSVKPQTFSQSNPFAPVPNEVNKCVPIHPSSPSPPHKQRQYQNMRHDFVNQDMSEDINMGMGMGMGMGMDIGMGMGMDTSEDMNMSRVNRGRKFRHTDEITEAYERQMAEEMGLQNQNDNNNNENDNSIITTAPLSEKQQQHRRSVSAGPIESANAPLSSHKSKSEHKQQQNKKQENDIEMKKENDIEYMTSLIDKDASFQEKIVIRNRVWQENQNMSVNYKKQKEGFANSQNILLDKISDLIPIACLSPIDILSTLEKKEQILSHLKNSYFLKLIVELFDCIHDNIHKSKNVLFDIQKGDISNFDNWQINVAAQKTDGLYDWISDYGEYDNVHSIRINTQNIINKINEFDTCWQDVIENKNIDIANICKHIEKLYSKIKKNISRNDSNKSRSQEKIKAQSKHILALQIVLLWIEQKVCY